VKIAWNAIVKNEEARIERCVNSLLPHIDYAVVVDTGSEDRTPEKISRLFADARKPFELYYAPFENFSQARNEALRHARASSLDWDYLLLADADMELVVEQPLKLNGGLSYDMQQRAGSLVYSNRRLVNRKADGWYMGVTHEYLNVPSAGTIDGAWFRDHADGANRADKLARDVALLEEAIGRETNPGLIERYTFYLANSYFELHEWDKAAGYYKRRVALGGFDEERWYAQLRYAHCCSAMGDVLAAVWALLQAYHMRPQRLETLHDLARLFRERGENHTSLLFSEAGLSLLQPKSDSLFVNDYAPQGLKEEFAICGYYSERHRRTAAKEANRLALAGSEQARNNLFWYLQPLSEAVPSAWFDRIGFTPPDGWVAMNPSVVNHEGEPLFLVRTVNYTITPEGQYRIRGSDGSCSGDHPIRTRNFIGSEHREWEELGLPDNWPTPPQYPLVLGLEDSRLLQWRGQVMTLSTVRELNHTGACEQVLAPLVLEKHRCRYGSDWRQILPVPRRHEKNWMPWIQGDDLRFVYRLGTLVNLHGEVVVQFKPEWAVDHISGGSQVVKIDDRTHLAIVHEARTIPGRPNRYYQHRFVNFRSFGQVDAISPPFFFHDRQIEFAAGMAYFPNNETLMVSYGVRDCEPWTVTMDVSDVVRFIYGDRL
jgi:glycosyltransferase involved in cell wall biosynthesis